MVRKSKKVIQVNSLDQLPLDMSPTVVTIGKFDGIHLGHQLLLEQTLAHAQQQGLVPAVITFDRHPFEVLNNLDTPASLIGPKQKTELLTEKGIELILSKRFDDKFSQLSAEDFVREYLVTGLKAKVVIVGEGFNFGAGALGDTELLRQLGLDYGFNLVVVPALEVDGRKVSTSWIRELLMEGDVTKAASLLGRYHATTGEVEHGLKIGREIGFPTANMARDAEGLLPRDAVYAGWLHVDGVRYMSALSVGINETFEAVPRLLEAHILDVRGLDLYGKIIRCEYVEFIRPAAKFNGVEDLVAEINRDLEKIRKILG